MTYDRLQEEIPPSQIIILTNADYVDLVKEQLPDILEENIVAEPAMRNTAPCILLAALKILKKNPDAKMIVAPSDHYIPDTKAFLKDLRTAFSFCIDNPDALMTMGITPTAPKTGYGYIEYSENNEAVKKVDQFREKPDHDTAVKFLAAGNFLWNAGIFIWSAGGVASAFAKAQPKMYSLFESGIEDYNTPSEKVFLEENYPNTDEISVDYAILEKSNQVFVLPVNFQWNDLGTWPSLYEELSENEESVAINAQLTEIKSERNIVRTGVEKKVIVQGLSDYIIVDQDDVLMILPKTAEQEIKTVRNLVMDKHGNHMG
jgi:mannose-1-phosphate guanylyltransferase